jgi:hypothetical protein
MTPETCRLSHERLDTTRACGLKAAMLICRFPTHSIGTEDVILISRKTAGQRYLWSEQPDEFREQFGKEGFLVSHDLASSSLFSLPRIVELAQALPENLIEYNAGDVAIGQDPLLTPTNGLSPEETIRRIESCGSWLLLKSVQLEPDYQALLAGCLADVREILGSSAPEMLALRSFVFVSSPGAVTPFHIDPECQFLLQIRGNKQIQLFDPTDRDIVSEKQLREYWRGAHRNQPYREVWEPKGDWHSMGPGTGVHIPVTAPHWVRVLEDVSISFSVTFETTATHAIRDAYRKSDKP